MRKLLFSAALALLATGPAFSADFLFDDFEDGNPQANNTDFNIVGDPGNALGSLGLAQANRTRDAFPIGFSQKAGAIVDDGSTTNNVYRIGHPANNDGLGNSSLQAVSDRTVNDPNEAFHSIGLVYQSGVNWDASTYNWLRVTTWLDPTQFSGSNITNAFFLASITQEPPGVSGEPPNLSMGPWDVSGSTLEGMALTTSPQTFLIPINESTPTIMQVDPFYVNWANTITGGFITPTSITDWSALRSVGFYFYRNGADAQAASLGALAYVDDIIFMENEPAFLVTPPTNDPVTENPSGTNSTEFDVSLSALPAKPVTLTFETVPSGQFTFSPAAVTLIPSGTPGANESLWNVPITVTATAVDDGLVEGDGLVNLQFTPSGDDLLYNALNVPSTSVNLQDGIPADVQDWNKLND